MKHKIKRFQEGDLEAEQKKRGLAASEGDKVGFFERIRMGNIDDPKSEAYKRFGAGRGQSVSQLADIPYTETDDFKNLNKAALREKSEITDERDAREAAVSSLPRKAPSKTAKAPIVTKEQLEKSGLSLRDYMNKQKGLKRKDNFASEGQKRISAAGGRGTQTEGDQGESEARTRVEMQRKAAMPGSKEDSERDAREQSTSGGVKKTSVINKAKDLTGSQIMAKKQEDAERVMNAARRAQVGRDPRDADTAFGRKKTEAGEMKKGGTVKKYKEGGTVSSASKRADGIALRGKTRGRMM